MTLDRFVVPREACPGMLQVGGGNPVTYGPPAPFEAKTLGPRLRGDEKLEDGDTVCHGSGR